jgi:RNA polymerase sigma-70 factor (ECF subfamily)
VIDARGSRMRCCVVMPDAAAFPFPDAHRRTDRAGRERLERLFVEHHERVWRTLRRLGLSAEAAADATQQAFLIAAERLADIREGAERSFLFGTAIRLARGVQRRARRVELDDGMDERAMPGARVDELVDQKRQLTRAERVLSELEQDLLEVFVLFELEGMTTPEIAELIAIPLGTAASRLRRAREAFRAAARRLELSLLRPEVP